MRTAVSESGRTRGAASWSAFIRHAKAPELPVVLLEDFAALTGLGFALIAVILTTVTGDGRWDAAGSLAIGLLLGCVAVVLATEMKSLLVGESARPEVQRAIVSAIEGGTGIERVIHLRTLHVGPESLLVAAKVAVSAGASAQNITSAIDQAERRVREAVPIAGLIFLEPDLYQESKLDVTDPAVRAAASGRTTRGDRAPGVPRTPGAARTPRVARTPRKKKP